jgi:hypothetical protein
MGRGDIDQCSFGFIVIKQTWTEEKDDKGHIVDETRVIEDVDLLDVSIVTYPAYEGTSCQPRSLWPEGIPAEVRSHRRDSSFENDDEECECTCEECKQGDCSQCSNADCEDENCRCHGRSSHKGEQREAKTKKVDGEDLTKDCFAYRPDDKLENWKLPIKFSTDEKSKSHIRNALARYSQTDMPDADEKKKAWDRIVAAAKKYDIEVSDEKDSAQLASEHAALRVRVINATLD